MSGGTLGGNGGYYNYSINFEYKTGDTIVTFRVFNTHDKKDIIKYLKESIDSLDKYWTQIIDNGKET